MGDTTTLLSTPSSGAGEDEEILLLDEDAVPTILYAHCFVGYFLTTTTVHFQSMRTTVANVWHPIGGISISELGAIHYLFRLYHEIDVDRISGGCECDNPMTVPISHVGFWVLLHDVPHGCMMVNVAKQLGNFVGVFTYYDTKGISFGYKGSMWIRGLLDVRLPLKQQKKLTMKSGSSGYVWFHPTFPPNHASRDCVTPAELEARFLQRLRSSAPLLEESSEATVYRLWSDSSEVLPGKLFTLAQGLSCWFKNLCRSKKATVAALQQRLEQLYDLPVSDAILEEIMGVKVDLNIETDREEVFWKQRERVKWLRKEDHNTQFFHSYTSHRRKVGKRYSSNRYCRRIAQSPVCPRCSQFVESVAHSIRDCSFAWEIWSLTDFRWSSGLYQYSFFDWFCWVFDHQSMQKCKEFIIFICGIWHARNKFVHEGLSQRALESPPVGPMVKINVDTAFDIVVCSSVSGVVVRDSNGHLLGSCIQLNNAIASCFAREAQAVIQGLNFACDLGCMLVILERDSLTVISKLRSNNEDLSVLCLYISEARGISRNFVLCQFVFTPRGGNVVAHRLAHFVFVNGKFCKDPKLAVADDFFFPGLNKPGNTYNRVGSNVTTVNVDQIPGLNTLGISLVRIDYAPYGENPPHTHPRGTEILVVVQGTLYVGFVTSNPENRLITKILYPGDVFVFPIGLIHFQYNVGNTPAVAFAGLSSQNAGVITIANAVFGSNPPINPDVLTKAFQLDKNVVTHLQSIF
ncbi:hypothetical protein GQ457_02G029080 [Hibiscus cannabinus]